MESWRKVMPDYTIKHWSLENFDLASAPLYVQEAVKAKKWAFAADYIRMYALYKEGGIYLDSDVKVLKSFDPFLHHRFFSSMEYHPSQIERLGTMQHIDKEGKRIDDTYISGIQIQAAVMGPASFHFTRRGIERGYHRSFHLFADCRAIRIPLLGQRPMFG